MSKFFGFAQKNFLLLAFALYAVVIAVGYFPALTANFMGDDFNYLRFLFFNSKALLEGNRWDAWLSPIFAQGTWIHFRPLPPIFFLLDYLGWGFNPVGYHLSDFVIHILISFLVFLIVLQLVHERWSALGAGLLFAAMPIHVEAISWFAARADGLSTIWYLIAILFFIYACERKDFSLIPISSVAFGLALMSKEAAITLPVMNVVYDGLYHRQEIRDWRRTFKLHVPFWILFALYGIVRLIFFHELGGYAVSRLLSLDWLGRSQIFVTALGDPFLSDVSTQMLAAIVMIAIGLLWLGRSRREMWFGAGWLVITILPSYFNIDDTIFDRFVYLPSVGLAIFVTSALTLVPLPRTRHLHSPRHRLRASVRAVQVWVRAAGWIVLGALVLTYSVALFQTNDTYARGTAITKLVPDQMRALYPTLPPDAQLFFTGFPTVVVPRGVQAFGWIVDRAMQIAYNDLSMRATSVDRFPLLTQNLDRTYFFEYNRRRVTDRADLIRELQARSRCTSSSQPVLVWNFLQDAQGWEAWNDLSDFQFSDGTLTTRALGNDPYMASPDISIPAMTLGDVEITMRVRAERLPLTGEIYWLATDQPDFSPDLKVSFPLQADGEWRTYRANIAQSGRLFIGDKIVRLRLDPADAPGDIAIKTIKIYANCMAK